MKSFFVKMNGVSRLKKWSSVDSEDGNVCVAENVNAGRSHVRTARRRTMHPGWNACDKLMRLS